MGDILLLLNFLRNKKICTTEQFIRSCNIAQEIAEKDKDGFISLREAICIVIKTIMNKKVKR